MISEAMSRCLKLLRSNRGGVSQWPLGSVGLTLKMATRCLHLGYASGTHLDNGAVLFRLTLAGARVLQEKIAAGALDRPTKPTPLQRRRGGPGRPARPSIADRNWAIFAEWSRDGWGPTAAILAERHGLSHGNQIGAICDQLLLECTDLTRRAHMRLDGIQVADASVSQRCPPYNVRRRLARKVA